MFNKPTDTKRQEFFLEWNEHRDKRFHRMKFESREDALSYWKVCQHSIAKVRLVTRTITVSHRDERPMISPLDGEVYMIDQEAAPNVEFPKNGGPRCVDIPWIGASGYCLACLDGSGTCRG